ncbi:ERCC4 domain-containing protein [Kurthia sp. YJT4]|uniref:ERCC4 domain-containing protein n=1 Tax=Kurthia sp. YJT4 TaxID=3049086 RepID=UPI00254B1E20|nr:ERCC4 domain-containing protein [Kurthia sp. YJT4]WIL37559.1 ERCC4 domain-containing protein [Kurthia sp. YJT4]
MIRYSYSDTELKKLLDTLTIVVDTRENVNDHILRYLHEKKIPHVNKKLDTGDYSAMIPKNPELGIMRDIYLDACLERKNSVDEITGNLQKDTRKAFENELIRSKDKPFVLICEDLEGYEKILRGDYRSRYDPKALLGTLKTFEARYGFSIVFMDKKFSGNYIYHHFYYYAREYLKKGMI